MSQSVSQFFFPRVWCDLLTDNAFLGIVAVGMTFVILSGGIDTEEWQRYMRESRLDRTQDYKLRAAANIQIHIPLRLMHFPSTVGAGLSERSRPVEYVFAGMEHRQTTSIVQDGLAMSHSAIEAGSGGRTIELRISYDPTEQQVQDDTSPNAGFDAFVNHSMGCITSLANWMKGTSR